MSRYDVVPVQQANAILGECPVWDWRSGLLYWVDIERPAVYAFDPARKEQVGNWPMPSRVGMLGLRQRGGVVVATRDEGVSLLDTRSGALDPFLRPSTKPVPGQFNDGRIDGRGRLWVGWLTDSRLEPGLLLRIDRTGACGCVDATIVASNGLGWSPDASTFYYTDSKIGTVWACDFDPERGAIANRRPFLQVPRERGIPDGLTVDAAGFVWIALYDGWKIIRCDPAGRIALELPMPVQLPTSCAFGGPDLDILFVTSAVRRLKGADLAAQPLAGALFAVEPGVQGLPESCFAG